jgi:acyl-CoA dehydrogenase
MNAIPIDIEVSEEFRLLHAKVRDLVQTSLDPISLQVETEETIPEQMVQAMRRLGLFGMPVPRAYGGLGLTTVEEMLIYEELTQTNASYRSRIGTSNGIGSMAIMFDGTEEQKRTFLPRIASGEYTTAFALTEPNAGSDAANISTSAVLAEDHWVLNGNKVFITNANQAQLFTVIALTDEKKRASGGVTAFIVEKGMPGFTVGPADVKMGLKGSHTHELVFNDCRVPRQNVIGGMERVGQGFRTAMKVLDKARLSMGASALGASRKVMQVCSEHLRRKLSSGRSKESLQADQFALADIAIQLYAARQMLYHTARLRDQGNTVTQEASMVKVFCTEMASRIADAALDILEEDGALTANQIEMFLRDVRLYRLYEGTSEIQRIIIARSLMK